VVRTTKLLLVALVVVGSLGVAGIGGTLATWSDSETSYNNTVETGSVDLLVAKCDADWANPGAFKDDDPYGQGLEPCFDAPLAPGANYTCYSLLWNAGDIDAAAYLHINNVSGGNTLPSDTAMAIYYDADGSPATSLVLVASGTMANLDSHEIGLGPLPAGVVRQLKLEVRYLPGQCPSSDLSFDIIFQLASDGFGDSEISQNYLWGPE
jgi:predicted ribosomally synthesized peptide with SipW-like signal peptide